MMFNCIQCICIPLIISASNKNKFTSRTGDFLNIFCQQIVSLFTPVFPQWIRNPGNIGLTDEVQVDSVFGKILINKLRIIIKNLDKPYFCNYQPSIENKYLRVCFFNFFFLSDLVFSNLEQIIVSIRSFQTANILSCVLGNPRTLESIRKVS